MSRQCVQMDVEFNAPVEQVFAVLSDHEALGKVLGADFTRIRDGQEHVNGVGSVRRIGGPPLMSFEETVTAFEPNRLVEYTVSRGSPIKNHLGRMVFSEHAGKTHLHYTIEFEPRLPLPFSGLLIATGLKRMMLRGLRRFARQYN
ncbi:MAG: SRPBCC family protein [Pseudomonadota bacterium]|nr:MxaD family protein [Pseudomonadales bacterium]MDY6920055.1 SRPBCC family protein [Pseudomonadota bacterium]